MGKQHVSPYTMLLGVNRFIFKYVSQNSCKRSINSRLLKPKIVTLYTKIGITAFLKKISL